MFKKLFFLAAILAAFLFSGSQVFAEENQKWWNFKEWFVDININEDSTFVVRETQIFDFHGNFHWTQRYIPKNRVRAISDVKVFDENGREIFSPEVEITEDTDRVNIKLNFDLTDTEMTRVFEYRVSGGLGYFEDYDELYWNAVSENRDVPIEEVEVLVHLPNPAPINEFQQKIYLGATGGKTTSGNYKIIDKKTLKFWGSNILPYENFTIVAGWPKGIVFSAGVLKVNSNPSGAAIILDEEKTNFRTPAVLEENYEISPGEHKISVEKFGWEIDGGGEKNIKVDTGKVVTADFELKQTTWLYVLDKLIYLIPILIGILLFKKYKSTPKIKKTIIAQYDPPDKLLPGEIGGLVFNSIRSKDFTATLIDLAYRGYLKIVEREEKFLWKKSKKYSLVRKKDFMDDSVLSSYEKDFLKAIFGSAEIIEVSDLKDKSSFRKVITKLPKEILEKLFKEREYFSSVPMARETSIILATVIATLGFIFAVPAIMATFALIPLSLFISLLTSIIILAGYLIIKPPPLTEKGIEAKWHALGFKEYLQVAERFRLGACTPETFEKYLSYAMVFGVEEKWAERFADIYKIQPDWYEGPTPIGAFNSVVFVNSISGMKASVGAAVNYSSPSGSSGFGGGGSAGGGGGGGGSSAG